MPVGGYHRGDAAVLACPKFAFPPEEIEAVLTMLQGQGEIFRPEESPIVSPDPADTKFLHCAQAAKADFIVTGNKRDFPDGPYRSYPRGERWCRSQADAARLARLAEIRSQAMEPTEEPDNLRTFGVVTPYKLQLN